MAKVKDLGYRVEIFMDNGHGKLEWIPVTDPDFFQNEKKVKDLAQSNPGRQVRLVEVREISTVVVSPLRWNTDEKVFTFEKS